MLQRPVEPGQYTAIRYAERLADIGAIAEIGTVGDSYGNALGETPVALDKTECVKIDGQVRTADELELATLCWAYWGNENRLHSPTRHLTLTEPENACHRESNAQSPRPGENLPSIQPGADRSSNHAADPPHVTNCDWYNRQYAPRDAMSCACEPCSTMSPCSITSMRSASRIVDKR